RTPSRMDKTSAESPSASAASPFTHTGSSLESIGPYGSKYNPRIIEVNLAQAERHERFDVKINRKRVCDGFAWKTLHIKTPIGCHDEKIWQAFMDTSDSSEHRSFYIQGPSWDCHYAAASNRKVNSDATEILDADYNADSNISKDPARHDMFWKFVLPKGWELDNLALSRDHHEIKSNSFVVGEKVGTFEFNTL
ncbi:unnamed protein product, partial [Cylindrotheca closterium]